MGYSPWVAETDMTEVLKPGPSGTLILSRPSLVPKTEANNITRKEPFNRLCIPTVTDKLVSFIISDS